MKALREPLECLVDQASYFVAASDLRVLSVLVDEKLRGPALDVLTRMEDHADNRSAFFRLDEPFTEDERGWKARAERLRTDYTARTSALSSPSGPGQPQLAPALGADDDLTIFGQQLLLLGQAVAALDGRDGVTVVLAPTELAGASGAAVDVANLVASPALASIRWIIASDSEDLIGDLATLIADRGVVVHCRVDEAQLQAELAGLMARGAAAPSHAPGGAWPTGRRPPSRRAERERKRKPGPAPDELRALVDAAKARQEAAERVRHGVAALAAGDATEAVRLQTLARDGFVTAGLAADAVTAELILGTYQTRLDANVGGGVPAALKTFKRALNRAQNSGLAREAAQAALGLAQLHLMMASPEDAFRTFTQASELAEAADIHVLAVEALRAAGRVAVEVGAERAAAASWKTALKVAARMTADEARASSVAECARLLAQLCRRYDRLGSLASDCDGAANQLDETGVLEPALKLRLGLDAPAPDELRDGAMNADKGAAPHESEISAEARRSETGS